MTKDWLYFTLILVVLALVIAKDFGKRLEYPIEVSIGETVEDFQSLKTENLR